MTLPISYAEMDVIIEREQSITKTFAHQSDNSTFILDNYGNTRQIPDISIEIEGNISSILITNTTLNCSVQINQSLVAGDSIQIQDLRVFKNGVDIDAIFNAPFYIEENCNNNIKINITGGSTATVEFTWLQPSGVVYTQAYVQRFSLTENKSYQRIGNGTMSSYYRGSLFKSTDYQYSLEKFWYYDDIFDDHDDTTYRIIYQTDDTTADSDILRQTYCLSNCRIESHQISQQDNQITGETISGFADRLFKIPQDVASYYFLNAYHVIQ